MSFLRRGWRKRVNASSDRFHVMMIYFFPVITGFYCYMYLTVLMDANISIDRLSSIDGYVADIHVERHYSKRNAVYTLYITLNDGRYFRLPSGVKEVFPAIESNIIPGDEITIFVRKGFHRFVSLASANDIMQINKNGVVIVDLKQVQPNKRELFLFEFVTSIFLSALAIYHMRELISVVRFKQ